MGRAKVREKGATAEVTSREREGRGVERQCRKETSASTHGGQHNTAACNKLQLHDTHRHIRDGPHTMVQHDDCAVGRLVRLALMASSKTVLSPSCVSALHSM